MFVGDPTPEDVEAVEADARALARDSGAAEAVRDGVSIARLVDMGDREAAAVIADQYVLTLDDLAAQLDGVTAVELIAAGYRLAALCNGGDHAAAAQLLTTFGTTLPDVLGRLNA